MSSLCFRAYCGYAGLETGRGGSDAVLLVVAVQDLSGIVYSSFSSSAAAGVMVSSSSRSPRRIVSFVSFPTTSSANRLGKSKKSATGFPLNFVITSPIIRPAFLAGEFGSTEKIMTPVSWFNSVCSSSCGIATVLAITPK